MPEQEQIKLRFTAGCYMTVYRNPDMNVLLYDGNVMGFDPDKAQYLLTTYPGNFAVVEGNAVVSAKRHEEIMEWLNKTVKPVEDKSLNSVGTGHQAGTQVPPAASGQVPEGTETDNQEDPALKGLTNEEKAAYTRALNKAKEGKQLTEFEEQVVKKVKTEVAKG